ncbi:MAG: cation:proton antiporter [Muribaculaceae bacterium]|nr:cation:proton antiporter [Muribaculaceae bacterium]
MQEGTSLFSFPLGQPVPIFLLVLVIILVAPIIFDRLRIPRVVGLIAAGVIVGPYCLNLLAYDASFVIFGEVGILYLMFLAAIEINMYHLKRNIRSGLIYGLLTFAIPMVAGLLVSRFVFSVSWLTSALLAVMYAAHTLVSYPTVSRFGLASNKGVVIAVAGTIVAVLLALLTLAEVVNISNTGYFSWNELLLLGVYSAVYGVALYFIFPRVTEYFFRKYNDPVAQFIFILAMVFVSSLVAELIGLEAILGAFFGGLVLNRFVPERSVLMRRITFVGNAIFIPYFLIGVGMLINVGVLFSGWGVIFCASVMAGVSLLSKWGAVALTRMAYRLDRSEGMMMFGLSSGKAAATIAATMIGYQWGLLSEELMNGAVVMILICCVVATLVTDGAAKRIRIRLTTREMEEEMEAEKMHPSRPLVAVANPLTAESLTRLAAFMRSRQNPHPLTLLFVRNNDNPMRQRSGRDALVAASAAALDVNVEAKEVERYDINVVTGLTNTMKERNATEIMLGFHHRSNLVDTFFGSITEQLVKTTNKMVILNRCFLPVDTLRSIYVYVPRNAEYETGFKTWLTRVSHLSMQIGRRVNFLAGRQTVPYIENYIKERRFEYSRKYLEMESWDDFIIHSSAISSDDLFIVIYARKGSLSRAGDAEAMPAYISRHMAHANIVMVYPAQFGDT